MQIKFNGRYDKSLFYRAVHLANRPQRSARMMYIFVALFFVFLLGLTVRNLLQTGDLAANLVSIAFLLVLGILLYKTYLLPYLGARKMWTPELAARIFKGTVDKKQITYYFPQAEKSYFWSDINRLRTAPTFITLVTLTGMLLIFPRRFFKTDADWARFKNIVETNVINISKK